MPVLSSRGSTARGDAALAPAAATSVRLNDRLEPLEVAEEDSRVSIGCAAIRELPVDGLSVRDVISEGDEPRVVRLIAQGPSPWRDEGGRG